MVCICLEPPSLHADVYASQPASLTQRTRCHLSSLACVSFAEALLPQHPRLLACWTSTFYSCWRTEVDEARLYQTELSHVHHLLMSCERHVPSFVFSWRARHPTEHASGSEPETQFDLRPCSLNLWLSELAHMLLALEQVSDRVYVYALHSRNVEVTRVLESHGRDNTYFFSCTYTFFSSRKHLFRREVQTDSHNHCSS